MDTVGTPRMQGDRPVLRPLTFIFALLLFVLILAILSSQWSGLTALIGFGVTILLAACVLGAFLGFLFAMPRVLTSAGNGADPAQDFDGTTTGQRLLRTNTNLERISDWLTTLLVGAGLTQLARAGEALEAFRLFVARGVRSANLPGTLLPGIAPLLLVAGFVLGFLFMYLYTRIEITRVFVLVEYELGLDRDAQRAIAGASLSIVRQSSDPATAAAIDKNPPPVLSPGSVSIDDGLDVMFNLLYRPEGYKRVITLSDQIANTAAAQRADYWFYRAAAFGQQLDACDAAGDQTGAEKARTKAMEAAERAVRIDPGYRNRLWMISNPNGPDNDLAKLREDPDFMALTGH